MTKLIAALCKFKKALKNAEIFRFTAGDTHFKGPRYQDINVRTSKKKSYQSE